MKRGIDPDKYLLSYSLFISSLQPDVRDMMSKILSILIDFTQTSAPFLQLFFKSLNLNNSGARRDIKNGKRQSP